MNFIRFLSWSLILVSVLLSSPNIPAQTVATMREVLGALTHRFGHAPESDEDLSSGSTAR